MYHSSDTHVYEPQGLSVIKKKKKKRIVQKRKRRKDRMLVLQTHASRDNLKVFKDFYLHAKAGIWP